MIFWEPSERAKRGKMPSAPAAEIAAGAPAPAPPPPPPPPPFSASETGGQGSSGGGGGGSAPVKKMYVRSNFETTPLFAASVVVGGDGIARIRLKLPDNIATF